MIQISYGTIVILIYILTFVKIFRIVPVLVNFPFILKSSKAYSEYMDVSQPADHFIACYTVLTRPNKVETAVHGCNLVFSLDSIMSLPR